MSDYNLHYWPVPFRGQFVRAVLAYAGKTWTESDGATISKLMAGPVADMPVPFMGPPMLIDRKADFAIAQSPAIVLYLGETLGLMPLAPALCGDRQDHQRDFVARIAAALAEVGWCGGSFPSLSGVVAVPFKANAERRHHIPKQRHRATNSAAYDAALRQRGSLTVWFTDAAIAPVAA